MFQEARKKTHGRYIILNMKNTSVSFFSGDVDSNTKKWSSNELDVVVWKILKDVEFVSLDDVPLILPDKVELHEDLWNGNEAELDESTYFSLGVFFQT